MNLPSISVVESYDEIYGVVITAVATWDGEVHTKREVLHPALKAAVPDKALSHAMKKAVAHDLLEFLLEKMQ